MCYDNDDETYENDRAWRKERRKQRFKERKRDRKRFEHLDGLDNEEEQADWEDEQKE